MGKGAQFSYLSYKLSYTLFIDKNVAFDWNFFKVSMIQATLVFGEIKILFSLLFYNIISYILMLVNNTPKVQSPFAVSMLHSFLNIQDYNHNCMKDIQTKYYIY